MAIVASTFSLRAELPEWVRNVEAGGRWHDAIFRTLPTPAGPVEVRRSPADAHDALAAAPGAATDRDLLALRARAAEEKLDFVAAEADWKAYAGASTDIGAGQLALADYYHRRLLPQREGDALAAAARAADPPSDRLLRAPERRSWRIFERIFLLVAAQQLPDAFAEAQYRAWIARYPQESAPYDRLFHFLVDRNRAADAEAVLVSHQRAFPADDAWVLKGRAVLTIVGGKIAWSHPDYEERFAGLDQPRRVSSETVAAR